MYGYKLKTFYFKQAWVSWFCEGK